MEEEDNELLQLSEKNCQRFFQVFLLTVFVSIRCLLPINILAEKFTVKNVLQNSQYLKFLLIADLESFKFLPNTFTDTFSRGTEIPCE